MQPGGEKDVNTNQSLGQLRLAQGTFGGRCEGKVLALKHCLAAVAFGGISRFGIRPSRAPDRCLVMANPRLVEPVHDGIEGLRPQVLGASEKTGVFVTAVTVAVSDAAVWRIFTIGLHRARWEKARKGGHQGSV